MKTQFMHALAATWPEILIVEQAVAPLARYGYPQVFFP